MNHIALEIENWGKIIIDGVSEIRYNERVLYQGLNINSIKFYFYLKERFGTVNVQFETVERYFIKKRVLLPSQWCYAFQSGSNIILVSGDDLINIAVLSTYEPPTKLDFDLFCNRVNAVLQKQYLGKYEDIKYDLFVNYSRLLYDLITVYKNKFNQKLPVIPANVPLKLGDDLSDPVIRYNQIEYCKDYNQWLEAALDMSTISIQIQIILPIYFESLIDLAFRIKLQKGFFDFSINYGDQKFKKNIFQYYEGLSIDQKLDEIGIKCFSVDKSKLRLFKESYKKYHNRKKRNKLLHGNSLLLKNTQINYYVDKSLIIGAHDRHRADRAVSESIDNTLNNNSVKDMIRQYEDLCNKFIDIFDDGGYFKKLTESLIFAHNPRSGGAISLAYSKFDDLRMPEEFEVN